MRARILSNGNLLIPVQANSDGVMGDATMEITPEHPDYERFLRDLSLPGPSLEEWEQARQARAQELRQSLLAKR